MKPGRVNSALLHFCLIAALGLAQPSYARVVEAQVSDLPADVAEALKGAEATTEILSVRGTERFDGQVLKVDELVMQKGAVIEMTAKDHPWVAIVAKRIRFVDPNTMSTVRWAAVPPPHGTPGQPGKPGANGGTSSKNGTDGAPGGHGGNGQDGGTADTPELYVMVDRIEHATGGGLLESAQLTFDFEGVDGGNGGDGGAGGTGGSGGNGRGASSGAFDCRRGPGSGGNGKEGGNGGNGGNGANGGDGASITFIAPQPSLDVLTAAIFKNDGGQPGQAGKAGAAGAGGSGGNRARGKGYCSDNASDGYSGNAGKPGVEGKAATQKGARGTVKAAIKSI